MFFCLLRTANNEIMMDESIETPTTTATTASLPWSLQSIILCFKSSKGLLYQGKWLLVTARDVARLRAMGITTFGDVLGDSDLSAVALAVKPWVKKRSMGSGFPVDTVDGLNVYKADAAEVFGPNSVYIAIGPDRPVRCVADEYLNSSSSSSSSSGGGGDGGGDSGGGGEGGGSGIWAASQI
jgi:uncharacterized membrane protein YgcG